MKISKDDYILGVWYCEKNRGDHQGYSIIIASKSFDGLWNIHIRNKFDNGNIKEQCIGFSNHPTEEQMIERAGYFYDVATHFFPDLKEIIEVKGDYIKMIFMVSMNEKLFLKENLESVFQDKRV
jgi:hypothetical protein